MNRQYKAFLYVVGNGRSEAEAAKALGVTQTTISRDLAAMEKTYPGLSIVRAICQRVHQAERASLNGCLY